MSQASRSLPDHGGRTVRLRHRLEALRLGARRANRSPSVDRFLLLDAAMLLIAAAVSLVSAPAADESVDAVALVIFCASVLVALSLFGVYRRSYAPRYLYNARSIVAATAIVAMSMTFLRVLIFDNPQAAVQAARLWLFASTYMLAARTGVYLVEMRARRAGLHSERTLIVGAGMIGRQIAQRLLQRPEFGLRPMAFLDDDPIEIPDAAPLDIPILHSDASSDQASHFFGPGLESAVDRHRISHVVISFSSTSHQAELDLVRRCQDMGVTVLILPRLFEGVTDRLNLERIGGIPVISVHPTDPSGWQYALKYGGDRVLAAAALAVTAPLLVGAALATLVTSGRPVMFKQRRVGLDGQEFDLLKIRTMRPLDAGEITDQIFDDRFAEGRAPGGVEGADRRTPVGRLLRRTSLDELPQLLNVIRGDMSLVGPRPERPNFVSLFDESVYRYADRHRVKSGITGWSQVHGLRGDTSIADRVEWDNYYIENRSLWLDVRILAMTIPAILRDRGE